MGSCQRIKATVNETSCLSNGVACNGVASTCLKTKSTEKRKYGTIWKTKNGRFGGRYKRKNVGTYDSEAEVEAAIKKCIENKSL